MRLPVGRKSFKIGTIPACDRQTDSQPASQPAIFL